MVANAGHWVGVSGDFPAAEVLGANCKAERFRGVRRAEGEVMGHFLGIVEFIGYFLSIDLDLFRVERVCFVD